MGKEHIARSFKSGNSVAIRIPAALGVEPNKEWIVERIEGELHIREKPPSSRKIDVDSFWGKSCGLRPLQPEDRTLEERALDWTGERLKAND